MNPLGKTLMLQGTGSSVGKSLLCAGLCRMFARHGINVAPFKGQNMSLNADVTADGKEIGRAQALQAKAARVPATVDMNPVLLKPESMVGSQVVLHGVPIGKIHAENFRDMRARLGYAVIESLQRLRARHALVVIEGAGSPAEINLQDGEIVNMFVARHGDAPVLLVGDIDPGGVFASLCGTLVLLPALDRRRVRGFLINKFRGHLDLLRPGLNMLQERTGLPTLGVIPHMGPHPLPDEDSFDLRQPLTGAPRPPARDLDVVVIRFPHMCNQDDFDPFVSAPGVGLRFSQDPADIAVADLVCLPGSKSVIADLRWCKETGLAAKLEKRAREDGAIFGICGGYQMLGRQIVDPIGIESPAPDQETGLGLLPVTTRFFTTKNTQRVTGRIDGHWQGLASGSETESKIEGFRIHMGQVSLDEDANPLLLLQDTGGHNEKEGAWRNNVAGSLVHGLCANPEFLTALLAPLRTRRDLPPAITITSQSILIDKALDRLADTLIEHIDWQQLLSQCELPAAWNPRP